METNKTKKRKIWKEAKLKWLENVPKKYKVSYNVDGLDDDSEYFHPEIILDDTLKIRGQGDVNCSHIYGESLDLKHKLPYGGLLFTVSLGINDREQFEYLVNNFDAMRPKLIENLKMVEQLHVMKSDLDTVQKDIIYNAINKHTSNESLERSAKTLYKIIEYLENERITT